MAKVIGTIIAVILFGLGLLFLMAAAVANPITRLVAGQLVFVESAL